MGRASWKGSFVSVAVRRRLRFSRRGAWATWSRSSVVPRSLVGYGVRVHCGKEFTGLVVEPEHIGYKLGALALTKEIGSGIHRFNRSAQKRKKADELLRQRKARKQKKSAGGKKKPLKKKSAGGKKR